VSRGSSVGMATCCTTGARGPEVSQLRHYLITTPCVLTGTGPDAAPAGVMRMSF
jgi:hypothetical protein